GRDDREPVVDVACVPDAGLTGTGPQVQGGGPGAPVDQQGALGHFAELDGAPSGPGVVGGEGAVAALVPHDGAGETVAAGGRAQHREVAQALGQAAGGRVGADQVQLDAGVPGGPAALELAGVPAHGRPCVADAERGVAGGRLRDQVVGRGEYLP